MSGQNVQPGGIRKREPCLAEMPLNLIERNPIVLAMMGVRGGSSSPRGGGTDKGVDKKSRKMYIHAS